MDVEKLVSRYEVEALDFAPGLLKLQHSPPHPLPRKLLKAVLAILLFLLLWATFGRVDVVSVAEGKLVPQSYLKIVQPAEQGIVRDILVKDNQFVKAGQVLMRMDTRLSDADTKALFAELKQKSLQLRRIDAELDGLPLVRSGDDPLDLYREVEAQYQANRRAYDDALSQERAVLDKARQDLAAAREVESKLRQVLPVYQAQEQAFEKLGTKGFAGNLMVLEKKRDRIEKEQDLRSQVHTIEGLKSTIAQSERKIAQVTSTYRQQLQKERVDTMTEYEKLRQAWIKQQRHNELMELKATQDGFVKDLATRTPGTVVSPGTVLLTLVPANEALQAEVWLSNEDVGFVHEGQAVKVKLAAYPFQKYGMADGTVSFVSADASDRQGEANGNTAPPDPAKGQGMLYYRSVVTLKRQELEADHERFRMSPGMAVSAEIKLADRTILEYLLSPVQKAFHEAARER